MFIGVNYDSYGGSNPHTHVFLPSGRRWVFNWIAINVIPILYGSEVCRKVQINIFNEDINEITPFENSTYVYSNAKVIICWYHRAIQKTQEIYKSIVKNNTQSAIIMKGFEAMCDTLSDNVETAHEYDLVKNIIIIWLENGYRIIIYLHMLLQV